jgi:hypothetical protein
MEEAWDGTDRVTGIEVKVAPAVRVEELDALATDELDRAAPIDA